MFDKNDLMNALGEIDDNELERFFEEKEKLAEKRISKAGRSFFIRRLAIAAALISLIALSLILLVSKSGEGAKAPDTSASGTVTAPRIPDPETLPEGPVYLMRVVISKDPVTGAMRTGYEASGVFINEKDRNEEAVPLDRMFLPSEKKDGGCEEYIVPVRLDLYSINYLVSDSTVITAAPTLPREAE